jgi:hypothetical protein
MSKLTFVQRVIGIGLAGALAMIAAGSVTAAPVLSSTAQVKSAAASSTTDVRWRHWRWRRGYAYNSGCHVEGGYHRPNGCW